MRALAPHSSLRPDRHETFHHAALLYAGEAEFVSGTVPFIRQGLDAGEAVLVAVGGARIELLQRELGRAAGAVDWMDMAGVGVNPARIIPVWRRFTAEHDAGGRVRGIGEPIWPGRTPEELAEAQRHEQLLNLAFSQSPGFRLMCTYDVGGLHPSVVDEARRSHPTIIQSGVEQPSASYRPTDAAMDLDELPPPPPRATSELALAGASPTAIRGLVSRAAALVGLSEARRDDLTLAVLAVATGLPEPTFQVWEERSAVVGQVRSTGPIPDPLAGREWPPTDEGHGRGLWMANQLCDLVQLRSSASGTAVRLRVEGDLEGRARTR